MGPGIYQGITFEEYKKIPAINKSGLDCFDQSPAHYYAAYLDPNRRERKETPAMRLGTAIHTRILEPDQFESRYILAPEEAPARPTSRQLTAKKPSADTVSAIKFWEEFDRIAGSRIELSTEDWEVCERIAQVVRTNPVAQELLEGGSSEVTLVWEDPLEKVLCKARVDRLIEGKYMLDLKSAICAELSAFSRKAAEYNYHRQPAWYTDGIREITGTELLFVFGAFEKEEPFASAFYWVPESVLEIGRTQNRRHLKTYARCLREGKWPGYPEELLEFTVPAWLTKKEDTQPIQEF